MTLIAASLGLMATATATADSIAIDWYGSGNNGGTTQSQMARSEWAGVVPQKNWNSFTGSSESNARALIDNNGTTTGATVTWSGTGMWDTNASNAVGDRRMMLGYLAGGSGTTSVTVSGLPWRFSAGGYDVYVYSDGDNNTDLRAASFSIGAESAVNTDASGSTFTGAFFEGSNYVRLRGVTGTSFTLTATPIAGPNTNLPRAPINGIQIVRLSASPANGISWMGNQAGCDSRFAYISGSFHQAGYWRNFIKPGASDQAVFSEGWPGPGTAPVDFLLGNPGRHPHNIYFGDFFHDSTGTCADVLIPGGPATVGAMALQGTACEFFFKSPTGPPDTARLTVLGSTTIGTSSLAARLSLHAGTMFSGPVIVRGPIDARGEPTSELRIAEDAILSWASPFMHDQAWLADLPLFPRICGCRCFSPL